ncbi:MAG TPA: hypothetical protein VHH36_01970, partial [Candidatus Thermoplasmatota archaeon]|nr:hypothetical protein [Candidatus Thermoplasmatota archaeon]
MKRTLATLALLASLLAPHAFAQQVPPTDAGVVHMEVAPDPTVGLPSIVRALVNVTTSGTVTVTFTYGDGAALAGVDAQHPSGNAVTRVVGQAGEYPFELSFAPPAERRGQTALVARVSFGGDTNASNNEMRLPTFVHDPRLRLEMDEPTSRDVLPHGVAFLRYTVRNDGNSPESPIVNALVTANATNWSAHVVSVPTFIPPGQAAQGVVAVRALDDNATHKLNLTLTAAAGRNTAVSASLFAPNLTSNGTQLAVPRAVSILGMPGKMQALPGITQQTFRVRNDGAVDDLVYVNATVLGENASWSAVVVNPNQTRFSPSPALAAPGVPLPVALRPGEEATLAVNLTRPFDAGAPNVTLRVNASSANTALLLAAQPTQLYNRTATSVVIEGGPDLELGRPSTSVLYQGETVSLAFPVRNLGLLGTATANLTLLVRDNVRTVAEDRLVVPEVGPGNATVVTWSRFTDDLKGAYAVSARLEAGAAGDMNASNDATETTFVVHAPVVRLRAPDLVLATPGATLSLAASDGGLSLENRGDTTERFAVALRSSAAWLSADWSVQAAPGERVPLPLEIAV